MKEWSIEDFLREVEELGDSLGDYDSARMPEGVCNGHRVAFWPNEIGCVLIDGDVVEVSYFSEYVINGWLKMTPVEYVKYLLGN